MARATSELERARRTRAGRVWLALVPALVFLILLIVFIAQNGQHVRVKFFGASGSISLALALLIAAVTGAIVVLLVGTVRILQLRLAARRHTRNEAKSAAAAPLAHETKPVETEGDPHRAGP
jgi:uncharacterized integral membrane protein